MSNPTYTNFYRQLGERIRDARKTANLNQDVLASYLEMSRASIVNIEKGRQRSPVHLLVDIARILNVDVCSLIPAVSAQELPSQTNWKKIVGKTVKGNKQASEKILGFLKELNTEK